MVEHLVNQGKWRIIECEGLDYEFRLDNEPMQQIILGLTCLVEDSKGRRRIHKFDLAGC
jgi:hypothetical protein